MPEMLAGEAFYRFLPFPPKVDVDFHHHGGASECHSEDMKVQRIRKTKVQSSGMSTFSMFCAHGVLKLRIPRCTQTAEAETIGL